MKAIVTTTFEIDITGWYEDEKLTKSEKGRKAKEELQDFSNFMPFFEYRNLKDVNVRIR